MDDRRGVRAPGGLDDTREGVPSVDKRTRPVAVRFWEKVVKTEACWVWMGARGHRLGYGRFRPTAKAQVWAHRWSYEAANGPIPEGLSLDHLCRNPACVRPGHLEPVTHRVNVLRGVGPTAENARKLDCKRGHSLSGDNLMTRPDSRRECRTCKRERDKVRRKNRK